MLLKVSGVRQLAEHRSVPEVDQLIDDLERRNLMDLAERPFHLEAVLRGWISDGEFGSRSELLHHNVEMRLNDFHNPGHHSFLRRFIPVGTQPTHSRSSPSPRVRWG